jgi:hypothetical protein
LGSSAVNHDQVLSLIGGLVALVVGLWAIVTQRIAVGEDEDGESNSWVYGWRAVAVGCAALAGAALFFASAAGIINLNWNAG